MVVAGLVDLAIAVAVLAFGIPVDAGSLLNISDTITTSVPGLGANHSISFMTNSVIPAGETIKVIFDPTTNAFDGTENVVTSDIQLVGLTLVSTCSAGTNNVTLSTSTGAGNDAITFTVCASNTVPSGTKSIAIGNNKMINPTSTQSYVIQIGGSMPDSGAARVAILPAVPLTAAISTNFSFSISGVATNTLINGVTTTGTTASTSLAFGTLAPGVPEILGQQLQVTTNAANGFVVTIHEDQDLTSSGGATIHLFANGNATATPSPWTHPSATINQPATYGHFGVTSNDTDLSADEFGTSSSPLFAGAFQPTATLAIFSNSGPADGVTQNIGVASVAYKIEISSLQAAGSNYTNNLIYVATPTF